MSERSPAAPGGDRLLQTIRHSDRLLAAVENAAIALSCALIVAMMLLISADALCRYLLTMPLSFSFDLVTMYVMPGTVFLAMAFTMRQGGHVNVDLLIGRIPPRLAHLLTALTLAAGILVVAVIVWNTGHKAWLAWLRGSASSGLHSWLIWPSEALVPLGMVLLLLRMAQIAAVNLIVAATGRLELAPRLSHGPDDLVEEAI